MSGDYTRLTFDPRNRYSGVLMQQGRMQLDADWIEEIDILRRRIRTTSLDILGPLGVSYTVSPNAFNIGWIAGPPADLSIGPGRLYVDGIQVEAFAAENATYNNQPFAPPQLAGFPLPPLPAAGDAVVYLDVWDREVTYIEEPGLLDDALGGADTTTRRQTVWQVRVTPVDNAACGMSVGDPPSAGRLTCRAIRPPAPDDPCILTPVSGYRGLENRLYRIEIHEGGALGTARFKWSRDNGSIVSAVRDIAVSGTQTTLTINRIGRDQFLRFQSGDWVTVTDDHRELMGEPGVMARVDNIDEGGPSIVLDRALPAGGRPFGANAGEIAARHTRVQKWDTAQGDTAPDADGLLTTGAGPVPIEEGIEVEFSTVPAGGTFRTGDYWVTWARTATARIDEFTAAPPRGIVHHYVQLAAINGLGGANPPVITDCRPVQQQSGDCCCTIIVRPGENIQAGIDALPAPGGCVCLKTGLHVIQEPMRIGRGSIVLKAESPGTIVRSLGDGPCLIIGDPAGFRIEGIDVLGIDFEATGEGRDAEGVVMIVGAKRVHVSHCGMSATQSLGFAGLHAIATDRLNVLSCRIRGVAAGIVAQQRCEGFQADSNIVELERKEGGGTAFVGIAYLLSAFPCRITGNAVSGALFGIVINDNPLERAASLAHFSIVEDNFVDCPDIAEGPGGAIRPAAIDVAATGCTIAGNRVGYTSPLFIGIRVTGWACKISGNQIVSRRSESDLRGPVAIAVGIDQGENTAIVIAGIVAHNSINGYQHGILCSDAVELVIEGNVLNTYSGLAIFGSRVLGSQISGNRIGGSLAAVFLNNGRQNRIASNDCRVATTGITLFQEEGPQIAGNRLDQIGFWGVFAVTTAARLDIVENRLVRCAIDMPNIAFAVGCFAVAGEANISANEVMDAGSDGGPQATSNADYGIIGDLVLEARIEGNLVTYSNVSTRNPQREDRALVMRGLLEFSQGDNELTLGFAIQMHGNKFIGNGRTALVELREFRVNDRFFIRFERVSFDHNYCSHLTGPVFAPGSSATVLLVGRRAIVMGNHIKSLPLFVPSVNFNNMPGPFIGNITAGGTINHADFPAPAGNFNMTAP